MIIETKYLGYVEIEKENIINFPGGIYGFENAFNFVLLKNKNNENPFIWLQCIDDKEPCFAVIDPKSIFADYNPEIGEKLLETVELCTDEALRLLVIATMQNDYKKIYFNLRCPIIINSIKNTAAQVILDDDNYPLKYLVSNEAED